MGQTNDCPRIGIGDEGGQCFNDPDQHPAQHRSNKIANPSQCRW
jgi:hypothetical protein